MAQKKEGNGARDDWEALKIVLDSLPSLKQRVLHKLRELRARKDKVTKTARVEKTPEKKEKPKK